MSRILHVYSLCLSSTVPRSNNLVIFHQRFSPRTLFPQLTLPFACSLRSSTFPMPINQGRVAKREQQWPEKPKPNQLAQHREGATATEAITDRLSGLSLSEDAIQSNVPVSPIQFGTVLLENPTSSNKGQKTIWKPKSYSTVIGASNSDVASADSDSSLTASIGQTSLSESREDASTGKNIAALSKLFRGPMGADFTVDNLTYCQAQIRATFYPKFENEKSDQEVRTRTIEMVSNGLATLEVSLKHSGSLFMYAGHKGGAYAKNSYGNIYTAVGVFVLGRMFIEAWGTEARRKQAEFNDFLENNRMCISMELVTAVLGDHGQRPLEDYVVVTAVTELGHGKPKFYSTPEIIAFCRTWRLPTNHVWLFSTRKSVTSFFAAYDALCEEGTATPVCKALDAVADISIPGSKDHIKVQGEILEGLVARIVSRESSKHMEKVLEEFPPTQLDGVGCNMGESLRDICATNRSDEKQQMKALLQSAGTSICPDFSDWFGIGSDDILSKNADRSVPSKFLQAHPADFSTIKLQEIIRLMKQRHFPAAFKCYVNFQKIESLARDNLYLKMVIHVHSDSAFRRYQKEMRHNPGLWPLYRGFFVDINLFKVNKEKAAEMSMNLLTKRSNGSCSTSTSGTDGLADEDANLMIKLKFLTYKLRTFLIRNGLSILFKEGPASYKAYYLKQMKTWGTSAAKQRDLSKMLDEWAVYIRRKYGNRQLSSSIYLSEAEPFLEQYAKRSAENQALIGSAGNLVRSEDFMAIVEGGRDEEGDLDPGGAAVPTSPSHAIADGVPRAEGLIVFFPGIPGCAKSALCKELLSAPGGLGDDRPVHSLMGDLIKGRYWQRVADERRRKPNVITLADKNAPNEAVWRQIEDMCRSTRASAVPIVPDSEGTDSNPFSLDALAVFIFRVLQRANHPGNLDQSSPNAGYVLLMFYHLYAGKNRREFESELLERFGSLVKMPLLKNDRDPLPDTVKATLDEGINLYKLHTVRHGRVDSTKGSYVKEWAQWEKRLREVLFGNAEYLNSIQVPFDYAVKHVLEQLRSIAQGNSTTPTGSEKRKFGNIVYAAVTLPVADVRSMLDKLADINPKAGEFFKQKDVANSLRQCHVTLAHKRSHGVTAVASYGVFLNQEVPVSVTALLYSDRFAALEAYPGSVDEEKVVPKNQWPHVTIWTAEGAAAKEANMLPQLVQDGKAVRVNIDPPMTATGVVEFY